MQSRHTVYQSSGPYSRVSPVQPQIGNPGQYGFTNRPSSSARAQKPSTRTQSRSASAAKPKPMPKFTTSTDRWKTTQILNQLPKGPKGEPLKFKFLNTNGNSCYASGERDVFQCFCEHPIDQVPRTCYADEVGGMSNHGMRGGPLSWKGSGNSVGFRVADGYEVTLRVRAAYKDYKDNNGVKINGVRSTDFYQIKTPQGNYFWLLVAHLSVGNLTKAYTDIKRFHIMWSLLAQAHDIESKYQQSVIMIGDLNTQRSDLNTLKKSVEGKVHNPTGITIPNGMYDTVIGEFKVPLGLKGDLRADDGQFADLTTAIDLNEQSPNYGKSFDIDHALVPRNMPIARFEIDRSIIGTQMNEGGSVFDHAMLKLDVIL